MDQVEQADTEDKVDTADTKDLADKVLDMKAYMDTDMEVCKKMNS